MAPNNLRQVWGYFRRCSVSQCNKELFERTSHWPDLCFYIFLNSDLSSKVKCPSTTSTFYNVLGGGPVREQMKCQRARCRLLPLWPGWLPPQQIDAAENQERPELQTWVSAGSPKPLTQTLHTVLGGLEGCFSGKSLMNPWMSGGGWQLRWLSGWGISPLSAFCSLTSVTWRTLTGSPCHHSCQHSRMCFVSECPPLASLSIHLTWKTSSFGKSVSLTRSIKDLSLQAWKSPNGFFNVLLLKGLISLRATMAFAITGYKNCGWSQVVQWIQTHLSIPFREEEIPYWCLECFSSVTHTQMFISVTHRLAILGSFPWSWIFLFPSILSSKIYHCKFQSTFISVCSLVPPNTCYTWLSGDSTSTVLPCPPWILCCWSAVKLEEPSGLAPWYLASLWAHGHYFI